MRRESVTLMAQATISAVKCIRCQASYQVTEMPFGCPECFERGRPSAVAPELDLRSMSGERLLKEWQHAGTGVWKYHQLLPVPAEMNVTLEEGGTPLLPMQLLQDELQLGQLWVKDERRNPTGSFKDRFFSVCISRARQVGADTVAIASSGNGGASAAAYAAAAGLRCVVVTSPSITPGWRAAIVTTGATLIPTASADRWEMLRIGVEEFGWYPLTNYVSPPVSSNWFGIEGYKTIAYEIAASLDWRAPDWITVPTSRGDGLHGIWRGFVELHELGLIPTLPQMAAIDRWTSLTRAVTEELDWLPEVPTGPSAAVSIGSNISTYQALAAVRQSGGAALSASDAELQAMVQAAGKAGIFLELSAAAGLCGARSLVEQGRAGPESSVVAVLTATGLTDPTRVFDSLAPLHPVPPTAQTLREVLQQQAT